MAWSRFRAPKRFAAVRTAGFALALSPFLLHPLHADHDLRELSGGFIPGGVVANQLGSPDGNWVVFDGCDPDSCALGSARRFAVGSPNLVIAGPYGSPYGIDFQISGDSRRVVFRAPTGPSGHLELWSVPIEGSTAPIRLHPALVDSEAVREFTITEDGSQVVFSVGDGNGGGWLRRAPTDGSAAAATIDQGYVLELLLFPAGSGNPRVLYLIDTDGDELEEIWAAYLSSSPPLRLWGGELPDGFDLEGWAIAPDGLRAVLLGEIFTQGVHEVASIRLDSANTFLRLNQNLVSSGDINDFALADDGTVVYEGDAVVNNQRELWSVPIDDSSAPVKLSGTLVVGGNAGNPRLAGDRVVYVADATVDGRTELWSAPIDGSAAPSRRSDTVPAGRAVDYFRIAANGTRIVYRANLEELGRNDLYRTSVAGTPSHARLTNLNPFVFAFYDVRGFEISPDSLRVAFGIEPDANFDGQVREQTLVIPHESPELLVNGEGVDSEFFDPKYLDPYGIIFRGGLQPGDRAEILLADRAFLIDGFESGDVAAWSSSAP